MKNIKMAETAARYGMTAAAFERLLGELGWMVDGQILPAAYSQGYLTKEREVTPRGDGFLYGIKLWRRL